MDKQTVVYSCNVIFLTIKRQELLLMCSNVDESQKLYTERNQDKRTFTMWLYLFEFREKAKLISGNRKSEHRAC